MYIYIYTSISTSIYILHIYTSQYIYSLAGTIMEVDGMAPCMTIFRMPNRWWCHPLPMMMPNIIYVLRSRPLTLLATWLCYLAILLAEGRPKMHSCIAAGCYFLLRFPRHPQLPAPTLQCGTGALEPLAKSSSSLACATDRPERPHRQSCLRLFARGKMS